MVIYLDGADLETMAELEPLVRGFTTNPSLMKKSGVKNYMEFAKEALVIAKGKPVSFEVLASDEFTMANQALEIASWGDNAYVKVPVITIGGSFPDVLLRRLVSHAKLNVTAVMTLTQVERASEILRGYPHIISIFAGRIADTGRDPSDLFQVHTNCDLLWASPRQIYDVVLAEEAGADIITLSPELLKKLSLKGKDLLQYSLETSQQFYEDGKGIEFV